jgi:hypothetical protein
VEEPPVEHILRALLRGAREAASGDIPAALRLALREATRQPGLLEAVHVGAASGVWRRLIREELLAARPGE